MSLPSPNPQEFNLPLQPQITSTKPTNRIETFISNSKPALSVVIDPDIPFSAIKASKVRAIGASIDSQAQTDAFIRKIGTGAGWAGARLRPPRTVTFKWHIPSSARTDTDTFIIVDDNNAYEKPDTAVWDRHGVDAIIGKSSEYCLRQELKKGDTVDGQGENHGGNVTVTELRPLTQEEQGNVARVRRERVANIPAEIRDQEKREEERERERERQRERDRRSN